jgi:3-oxoacyl-[acyl-carrier protein] reductase
LLLQGKTAVITGCRRGIGKATLEAFAREGADVIACARQVDDEFTAQVGALAAAHGVSVTPIGFDLADSAQVKEGAKQILAVTKLIDILVNNAGVIKTGPFHMMSLDVARQLFEVNLFSQLSLTQYLTRSMIRNKRGSIVNISSSAAIEGNEGRTAYASSKAALITASKVLARELAVHNIRVNAVAPGLTQTDMMVESTAPDALANTLERICMKRTGRPEEIANAVVFLASDLSSYMTGQVLRVDGGM